MDLPVKPKQQNRPRSKSDPYLYRTSWIDLATDRGLQNAQKKLVPMVDALVAESGQRMAEIMGQNPIPQTVTAEHTDDTHLVIIRDILTQNIKMLDNLKNDPLTPKKYAEDISQLLITNIQAKNQIQFVVMGKRAEERLQNLLGQADRQKQEFETKNTANLTRMSKIEEQILGLQAEYGMQPEQSQQNHDIFMNCCIYIGIPLAIILPVLGFLMHRATL